MTGKYSLITFGCQTNKNDSARIRMKMKEMGWEEASEMEEADLAVINMCSVRQSAVDRVYGRIQKIRKLKKEKEGFKALLTGCLLSKDLSRLREDFDYILAIKTLPYWEEALKNEKFYYHPDQRDQNFCARYGLDYFQVSPDYESPHSVYIPVSTGCDRSCTYCVVPSTRGPLHCREEKEILREAEGVLKEGAKEIWLVGQNVNSYRREGSDFADLLRRVNGLEGDFWLNFTSSHPNHFSDKLITTFKECGKVGKYLSLPLQSGDDEVLKKMARGYSASEYKKLVGRIREEVPEVVLSTDVIVGFPGETRAQFENTLDLFRGIRVDMAYVAEYSPRPGTPASKMEDTVSRKEKERRRKEVEKVLKNTALAQNEKYLGREVEVLVHEAREKVLVGKTKNYKTVKIENGGGKEGSLVKARVIDASPWGLKARKD